jgi:hypothetical protein
MAFEVHAAEPAIEAVELGSVGVTCQHRLTRRGQGQFVGSSRRPYRRLFDRDPASTAALIDSLEAVPAELLASPAAALEVLDTEVLAAARSHFPELRRRGRERSRGAIPPARAQHPLVRGAGVGGSQAASPSAPEPVELPHGLTDALFPEVARRRDQPRGRVTWIKGD